METALLAEIGSLKTLAQKKNLKSLKDAAGVIINATIRAEIYTDSTLVGALKVFENILFVSTQMISTNNVESIKDSGLNGTMPQVLKISAAIKRPIK